MGGQCGWYIPVRHGSCPSLDGAQSSGKHGHDWVDVWCGGQCSTAPSPVQRSEGRNPSLGIQLGRRVGPRWHSSQRHFAGLYVDCFVGLSIIILHQVHHVQRTG